MIILCLFNQNHCFGFQNLQDEKEAVPHYPVPRVMTFLNSIFLSNGLGRQQRSRIVINNYDGGA